MTLQDYFCERVSLQCEASDVTPQREKTQAVHAHPGSTVFCSPLTSLLNHLSLLASHPAVRLHCLRYWLQPCLGDNRVSWSDPVTSRPLPRSGFWSWTLMFVLTAWRSLSCLCLSVFSDKLADLQFSSLLLWGCPCSLHCLPLKSPLFLRAPLCQNFPHILFWIKAAFFVSCFLPSFRPLFGIIALLSYGLLSPWHDGSHCFPAGGSNSGFLPWVTLHSGALCGRSGLWSSQLAALSMELLTYKQTEARGARGSVILSSPAWGSASPYEWKMEATILSAALTSNLVCVIWGLRNVGGPPHLGTHCLLWLGSGGSGSPNFLATPTQSGGSVKVSSNEGLGHCSSAMDSNSSYQGQFLDSLNHQKYN